MSIKSRFTDEPVWLMDGSAFVYRGFYANQAMSRSDGTPTGAIFIVARILLRILREEQPQYFAFILDGKGKNFRHEAFPEYKANRDATPDGLIVQLDPIHRLVTALGLHLEISSACEADDCIASIAARYERTHPVVIVGTDKDLRQCLAEQVIMWDPASKNEKLITLDSFTAETGLAPSQWPDLQALVGDSSDNIPGIPGVGPKTAEKLMQEFACLEAIRDGFASLAPSLQKKFEGRLDDMFLYRNLTTLKRNCCADVDLDSMRRRPVDVRAVQEILREYELSSIERELASMLRAGVLVQDENAPRGTTQALAGNAPAGNAPDQLSLFDTVPACAEVREQLPCVGSADALPPAGAEVVVLEREGALLLSVGSQALRYTGPPDTLTAWLSGVMRIITPDVKRLWKSVPAWQSIPVGQWYDLGLASYLLNPEEGDVSWHRLVSRYGAGAGYSEQGELEAAHAMASDFTRRLQGADLETLLNELEMPLIPVLADMERAGVQLDTASLAAFLKEVQDELCCLTGRVHEAAGEHLQTLGGGVFNIRSSQQLGILLFERLGLPRSGKTRGGQARTDQEALEKLQGRHAIIDALLAYRKLEKMRSTYLEPLPRLMDSDGRIRTTFNQTATATGRLSSSNPNLQNIPIRGELGRRMRQCFTAAPGKKLISADYSQIELRVLAHLSQEPTLLEAFREGDDIHYRTAMLLFDKPQADISPDERRNAKTINFGLVYGMGPQKLAKSIGVTLNEAKAFIERYFTRLSRLKDFYEKAERLARDQGYVTTMTGRRRLLPEIHSSNTQMQSQARRQAINTIVQGSAADIIKLAMLSVHGDEVLRTMDARLILQVHDELLVEVPAASAREAAQRVERLMAEVTPGGVTLDVPLVVEAGIGDNWGEAH